METEFMEDKAVQYAYIGIHNFFGNLSYRNMQHTIDSVLIAASSGKIWKKRSPSDLLFFMENLDLLFEAAFIIYYDRSEREGVILDLPEDGVPDLSANAQFSDSKFFSNEWNNFPRNLTSNQYHNPYKGIKKFCKYMAEPEWKKALKNCTEYALGPDSILETFPSYNLLVLRRRLLQLIEACHLIEIRINKKNADTIINEETGNIIEEK
jgi:hypothetical protein